MESTSTHSAVDRMRTSILNNGDNFGIDARLILVIIMIESRGNVGIGHAYDGQNTNEVMQSMGCAMFEGNFDLDQVCESLSLPFPLPFPPPHYQSPISLCETMPN